MISGTRGMEPGISSVTNSMAPKMKHIPQGLVLKGNWSYAVHTHVRVCLKRKVYIYHLEAPFSEDVPLAEYMYHSFTCMPGESYCRWPKSLFCVLCCSAQSQFTKKGFKKTENSEHDVVLLLFLFTLGTFLRCCWEQGAPVSALLISSRIFWNRSEYAGNLT